MLVLEVYLKSHWGCLFLPHFHFCENERILNRHSLQSLQTVSGYQISVPLSFLRVCQLSKSLTCRHKICLSFCNERVKSSFLLIFYNHLLSVTFKVHILGDHNLLKKPKSILVDLFVWPVGELLYYAQNCASLCHSSQSPITFIQSLIQFELIN